MLPSKLKAVRCTAVRGYTLLEMVAILAIAAVAVAAFLWSMADANKSALLTQDAQIQAQEMGQLADAVLRYGDTLKASLAAGQRFDGTPSNLIGLGLLPATFAKRFGTAGTSPLGQTYAAAGVKDPISGNPQAIVWVSSMPRADAMSASGLAQGAIGQSQFANQVITDLVGLQRTAGVVLSGTMTATSQSFAVDASAWLVSAPNVTTPAVLANLAVLGQAGPPPPPPSSGSTGNCNVIGPNSATSLPSCPAGTHVAAQWPYCGAMNRYTTLNYPVFGTEAGIITVGQRIITGPATNYPMGLCFIGPLAPQCGGVAEPKNTGINSLVLLDGSQIGEDYGCGGTSWVYPCGSAPNQIICQQSQVNPTVAAYKANAIEQLCCKN